MHLLWTGNCILTILASSVLGYRQDVLDFCSEVLGGSSSQAIATKDCTCFGSPGKRGPMGVRGFKGAKGEKGDIVDEPELTRKLEKLEQKLNKIARIPEVAVHYCLMGMKSGAIPDASITSSTDHDAKHARKWARLDVPVTSASVGAWCPKTSTLGEWIQVDLGFPRLIAGTVIQGRHNNDGAGWWVTAYTVACGTTQLHLPIIRERDTEKIFRGNTDMNTKVINWFPEPLTCRYIRIYPKTWHSFMCLRMDLVKGDCL